MKYKYKIGEIVEYHDYPLKEKVCECCGHVDYEDLDIIKKGKITSRSVEEVYSRQDIIATDEIEILPNGKIVHKPYISPFQIEDNNMNFYKIGKDSVSESNIV